MCMRTLFCNGAALLYMGLSSCTVVGLCLPWHTDSGSSALSGGTSSVVHVQCHCLAMWHGSR